MQILVLIAFGILAILYLIFFVSPVRHKRLSEATDENQKKSIRGDIMALVVRIIGTVVLIIFLVSVFFIKYG